MTKEEKEKEKSFEQFLDEQVSDNEEDFLDTE